MINRIVLVVMKNPSTFAIVLGYAALLSLLILLSVYIWYHRGAPSNGIIWPINITKHGIGYTTELSFHVNSTNSTIDAVPNYLVLQSPSSFYFMTYDDMVNTNDSQFRSLIDTSVYRIYPNNINLPQTLQQLRTGQSVEQVNLFFLCNSFFIGPNQST